MRSQSLARLVRAGITAVILAAVMVPALTVRAEPAGAPVRVASINLCTDLLALLIAGPGQLKSVTFLAANERSSGMWEDVRRRASDPAAGDGLIINHGLAEELFSLDTDLVLAGRYSARPATMMLTRLGKRVEVFDPVTNLAEVREHVLRVGQLLHRDEVAQRLVAEIDRLETSAMPDPANDAPLAAVYFANGFSPGASSLPHDLLRASGFRNLTAEIGVTGSQVVPLEKILMADPDFIITAERYPGRSRGEDIIAHPALRQIMQGKPSGQLFDRDWSCGTPEVAAVIERLRLVSSGLRNHQSAERAP